MEPATAQRTRRPAWLAGLAPLVVLAVAIGLFVLLDAPGLDRIGAPQEELAVERTVLKPDEIQLHVRNEGADPVQVKQVIVNDGFAAFTQTEDEIGRLSGSEIDVDYPWIEGQDYEVVMRGRKTPSDGRRRLRRGASTTPRRTDPPKKMLREEENRAR